MHYCRTITAIGLSAALLAACGSKEDETAGDITPPGSGGAATPTMPSGEQLGAKVTETVDKTKEMARKKAEEAIAALKSEYTAMLDGEESKAKPIKAAAMTLKDSRLTGLVADLDSKFADVREKISAMSPSDEGKAASLQDEIERIMSEIPRLFEEAKTRLDQLKGEGMPEMPEMPGGMGLGGGGEKPEK